MGSTDIRRELHEYIDHADDRLLKLIYGMMLVERHSYEIPEWHEQIVHDRLEAYEKNPENVISWDELKSTIKKLK
jgi:Putative addiction module component